jgi:hypothetical protein
MRFLRVTLILAAALSAAARSLHRPPVVSRAVGLDFKSMTRMAESDIVHITSSLEEARGEVRLLAGWEPVSSSVLDTPRPDSPNEAYRQLVLRNSLADELFRQQCVSGVLACGLGDETELKTITPEFVAKLATGKMVDAANVW